MLLPKIAIIGTVILFCLCFYVQAQRDKAKILEKQVETLTQRAKEAETANQSISTQHTLMMNALDRAAKEKKQLEKQANDTAKKLKAAQKSVECAHVSVPDDVISLQRESIMQANARIATP
jgi:predicted Holliday junction resolvase-like endonuclease